MKPKSNTSGLQKQEIIGWRENVALPDFGIERLAAKIDTGARTSALHAFDQRIVEHEGRTWVEFTIPLHNRRSSRVVRAPLIDEREIKNTSGVPERRLVVQTTLILGRHNWQVEVSLANRERMEFDLIIGRSAIRKRGILVDPGRSFVLGRAAKPTRATAEAGSVSTLVRHLEGSDQ